MTDQPISITFKGSTQDFPWLTVTGTTPDEVNDILQRSDFSELVATIATVGAEYRGFGNAATLTQPQVQQSAGPTASASSTSVEPERAAAQPSSSVPLLKNGEHITEVDRFGNRWEYNAPDAPSSPRGPMVKGTKTSQKGNVYTMWYDPAASSGWYPNPKVDKAQQVESVFAN